MRLIPLFAIVILEILGFSAHAATIVVDSTNQENPFTTNGNCTLGEAIVAANTDRPVDGCTAGSGADTIELGVGQTYNLGQAYLATSSALPAIAPSPPATNGEIIINGHDSILNKTGASNHRILEVGEGGNLTLNHLRIAASPDSSGVTVDGGCLFNRGTLFIRDSAVLNCSTNGGRGGAIYNDRDRVLQISNSTIVFNRTSFNGGGIYSNSNGRLDIFGSMIGPNTANSGGGLYAENNALAIVNTTFADNIASTSGSAIYAYADSNNIALTHATISSNSSSNTVHFELPGSAVVTFRNSIIHTATSARNCNVAVTDRGGNIDSGNTCGFLESNRSRINIDPLLDLPRDNGGSTFTQALRLGSPAINLGIASACQSMDQRGRERRTAGGFCDSGAYEAQAASITAVSGGNQTTTIGYTFPELFSLRALDAVGNRLGGVVFGLAPSPPAGPWIRAFPGEIATGNNGQADFFLGANDIAGEPYEGRLSVLTPPSASSLSVGFSGLVNARQSTVTSLGGITPNPVVLGNPVTVRFSVGVTPPGSGSPDGEVIVGVGRAECRSATSVGQCSLTPASVGESQEITVNYTGGAQFAPSSASGRLTVVANEAGGSPGSGGAEGSAGSSGSGAAGSGTAGTGGSGGTGGTGGSAGTDGGAGAGGVSGGSGGGGEAGSAGSTDSSPSTSETPASGGGCGCRIEMDGKNTMDPVTTLLILLPLMSFVGMRRKYR